MASRRIPARVGRRALRRTALCLLLPTLALLSPGLRADYEAGRAALDRGDYPVARRLLEKAGEAGDTRAQTLLGTMYRDGEGVAKNDARARAWFERAAELGNASAQYNLGRIYREGHGVPRDDVLAVQWYTRAAEQELSIAQYFLARHYELGRGTPRDYGRAYLWFTLAARQGEPEADEAAGRLRGSLTTTQIAWVDSELQARGQAPLPPSPADTAAAGTVGPDDVSPPADYRLAPLEPEAHAAPTIPELDVNPDKTVVAAIQRALTARGYAPGPADGAPGGRTTAAIQAYQRSAGLPVDGLPTRSLLAHLEKNPGPVSRAPTPSGRDLVRAVQKELAGLGYQPGPADGLPGGRTRAAVKTFQRDQGLRVDGAITPALLEQIRSAR